MKSQLPDEGCVEEELEKHQELVSRRGKGPSGASVGREGSWQGWEGRLGGGIGSPGPFEIPDPHVKSGLPGSCPSGKKVLS